MVIDDDDDPSTQNDTRLSATDGRWRGGVVASVKGRARGRITGTRSWKRKRYASYSPRDVARRALEGRTETLVCDPAPTRNRQLGLSILVFVLFETILRNVSIVAAEYVCLLLGGLTVWPTDSPVYRGSRSFCSQCFPRPKDSVAFKRGQSPIPTIFVFITHIK